MTAFDIVGGLIALLGIVALATTPFHRGGLQAALGGIVALIGVIIIVIG